MSGTIERLLTLRVNDVMSRKVISIPASTSMSDAADVLAQHFISGAPVTGQQGQCVGMLSATDFVRCVASVKEPSCKPNRLQNSLRVHPHSCPVPATDRVASHMSALLQTVGADQSLTGAARMMCDSHIHRLVVLDDKGHPTGMLTSLDIVAALINVTEE